MVSIEKSGAGLVYLTVFSTSFFGSIIVASARSVESRAPLELPFLFDASRSVFSEAREELD